MRLTRRLCVVFRSSLLISAALAFVLAAVTRGDESEEKRDIVFQVDPVRDYPKVDDCFLNSICVDFFFAESGHVFHFPCNFHMTYDNTACHALNDSFPLNFKVVPYDGPGPEYFAEDGFNFEFDITVYNWGAAYGHDFDENFVPPLTGSYYEASDLMTDLCQWGVSCVAGIAGGLYTLERFNGEEVQLTLRIEKPNTGVVKWKNGSSDKTLYITHADSVFTEALDIGTYEGEIKIAAVGFPAYKIYHAESFWQPGIEGWIHKVPWQCSPPWKCACYHKGSLVLRTDGDTQGELIHLDFDDSESEELSFELACNNSVAGRKLAQDLVAEALRYASDPYPHAGDLDDLDTVVVTIRNLYGSGSSCTPGDLNASSTVDIDDVVYLIAYIFVGGPPPVPAVCCGDADGSGAIDIDDIVYVIAYIFTGGPAPVLACGGICAKYADIGIQYYLATDPQNPLDSIHYTHLSDSDPKLANFNNGTSTEIVDTFCLNVDDYFPKDTNWSALDTFPRYVVRIIPAVNAAEAQICSDNGWIIASNAFTTSSNDEAIVPFERPIPDFAVDSVRMDSPPFLEFGDQLSCTLRVTNEGIDWPIPGTPDHPADYVKLRFRVIYENRCPDTTIVLWQQDVDSILVSPPTMPQGSSSEYAFDYEVPSSQQFIQTMTPFLPLRVRIVCEVNGGNKPLDPIEGHRWSVWEESFSNNASEIVLSLVDMPDLALPSDQLHNDGEAIDTCLPAIYSNPPDSQWRYLYVSDPVLGMGHPDASVHVDIGAGPYNSSPTDSSWLWFPCAWIKDFTDSESLSYDVFGVNAWNLFTLGKSYLESYCFRVAFSWNPECELAYLYVDRDGASPVYNSWVEDDDSLCKINLYHLDQAGTVSPHQVFNMEYQILNTDCWSVGVWNVPRSGTAHRSTEGNMFWDDSLISMMYDNSLIVTNAANYHETWFSIFEGWKDSVVFEAHSPLNTAVYSDYEYANGSFGNNDPDSTLVIEGEIEYYLPSLPDKCVLIERVTVCNAGTTAIQLHVGEGIDWDIPDGSGSVENRSGVDTSREMVYQCGPLGSAAENHCAGASFCNGISGAVSLENDEWVYPYGSFHPYEIGELLATHSGLVASDSVEDLCCVHVVGKDITLQPEGCYVFCMVMASSLAGPSDLQDLIDRGKAWIIGHSLDCPGCGTVE